MISTLASVAAGAAAQGIIFEDNSQVAFEQVQQAYYGLSRQKSFTFTIDITESKDLTTKRYSQIRGAIVLDSVQQSNVLKFELSEYAGHAMQPGSLTRRIVADGSNFYDYDARANTFRAATYSGERRRRQFFQLLDKATAQGPSSLVGRLVNEVYGSQYPRVTNWIPGSRPQPAGTKESTTFFIKQNRNGGETSIAFGSPLMRIMYTDRAGQNILTSPYSAWTLNLGWGNGWLGNFGFKPPLNAREIVGS
ncbi:MAG: hypothetical protein H7Y17_17130 [Chlorobia bacterium]|nr:hypothetical protein [Fimbriimonadaceae bacterium]